MDQKAQVRSVKQKQVQVLSRATPKFPDGFIFGMIMDETYDSVAPAAMFAHRHPGKNVEP